MNIIKKCVFFSISFLLAACGFAPPPQADLPKPALKKTAPPEAVGSSSTSVSSENAASSSPPAPEPSSPVSSVSLNSPEEETPPSTASPTPPNQNKLFNADNIHLNVPLEQAWEMTNVALKKAGFEIMQQDPQLHSYFVADLQATGQKFSPQTPVIQVQLRGEQEGTVIVMLDASNALVSKATLNRLYLALP